MGGCWPQAQAIGLVESEAPRVRRSTAAYCCASPVRPPCACASSQRHGGGSALARDRVGWTSRGPSQWMTATKIVKTIGEHGSHRIVEISLYEIRIAKNGHVNTERFVLSFFYQNVGIQCFDQNLMQKSNQNDSTQRFNVLRIGPKR